MKGALFFAGTMVFVAGICCGMEIGSRQTEAEQRRQAEQLKRAKAPPPIARQLPRPECIEICNTRERMAKVQSNNPNERTGP